MELKRRLEIFLGEYIFNKFWGSIIIALTSIYFAGGKESDFNSLIKITCAILSSVIGIIIYGKIPNIKNQFAKYLGIGFIYAGFIHFIEILLLDIIIKNRLVFIVSISISFFEISIIMFSIILYKKKASFFVSVSVFLINLLAIFLVFKSIYLKKIIINTNSNINTMGIVTISLIIIITITIIIREKNIKNKKDKFWLIGIMFLFSTYGIIMFIGSNLSINTIYIREICKLLAFITTFEYVEKKLLNNSYKYTLDKLTLIKKTRSTMKNNLIKKERLLMESRAYLKKSEERYGKIIESISEGILIFENNTLIYINSNGMQYVWYLLNNELNKIKLNLILNLISNNTIKDIEIEKGFVKEYIILNKDNKLVNISLTLKNTSEREKILLIENIEEREELQKLRKERERVKVMDNIKDEFYSNISHELRTPINVINSALQLNSLIIENNMLEEINKNNIVIRRNCLRLIRTINNFIDSNRISEGFLEPDKKIYNIVNIVEEVVMACSKYMILMDNKLIFDNYLEYIYVKCDRNHIERIMLNILSNSLKYGEFGGSIDVVIKSSKEEVRIYVRNDAPVIPEKKRDIIFDKFTKLDSSFARSSEGSGLGLYITKELIELNGGSIKINSEIEDGNLFDIRFPCSLKEKALELDKVNNYQSLKEKVNIEFSDIYFN